MIYFQNGGKTYEKQSIKNCSLNSIITDLTYRNHYRLCYMEHE